MATLNFSLTVPDAQVPRLLAALRNAYGAGKTQAELVEDVRQSVRDRLKVMVKTYETLQREQQQSVPIVPPDIT
jgi:hypothetical protein